MMHGLHWTGLADMVDRCAHSTAIKSDEYCVFASWLFDDPAWHRGGHWYDNKPCYASNAAQLIEGDHGDVQECHEDGRALGPHCPELAPFHRGWCGGSSWGLMFVRG